MPDELSNAQVALLCDIGQAHRYDAADDRQADIATLVQAGYIATAVEQMGPTLKLTEKATTFLSARGATLNEA